MVYFFCGLFWAIGAIIYLLSAISKLNKGETFVGAGYIIVSIIGVAISVMFFYFYVYY